MLNAEGNAILTRMIHSHRRTFLNPSPAVTSVTVTPGSSAYFALTYPNSTDFTPVRGPKSDRVEIFVPNVSRPTTLKWSIKPYGGSLSQELLCGEITVSAISAG